MDILGILGIILIVLAILGEVPLLLGIVLGIVLVCVGGGARFRRR